MIAAQGHISMYRQWHPSSYVRIKGIIMNIGGILIVILILVLLGVIPTWPHSRSWGYAPGGTVGTLLIIVIILVLLGWV